MLNRLDFPNEFTARRWQSPDELKAIVRDGLMLIEQPDREQLTREIEREMNRAGLALRSHLILIGIPAASHAELTPNEVGHFVRFIDMTAPRLMPAIERVLARYLAFWREQEPLRPAA